ncbi:MAG: type II and III secretion system protein, partial [bacterium]
QVQVEAKIIELKQGAGDSVDANQLGVSWKYRNPNDSNDSIQNFTTQSPTLGATAVGLYAQMLGGNVDAYLQALEKVTAYELVAAPWITALNHEEAEILIGQKLGYKTSLTTQTGTLQEIQFLEVGTKLKFIPHINEDGYIIMDVYPAISEGSVVGDVPQEDTTETKNRVLVKDGQPIVIGGLTKNYTRQVETGVPILSSIPLLGILFKNTEIINEKREIMIIITPHIVTPAFLEEMSARAKDLNDRRETWLKNSNRLVK